MAGGRWPRRQGKGTGVEHGCMNEAEHEPGCQAQWCRLGTGHHGGAGLMLWLPRESAPGPLVCREGLHPLLSAKGQDQP